MKKIPLKVLNLATLAIPFLLVAQENKNAMNAVATNSNLMAQLAQLLPMGINPYATVFVTSILSKLGIHNEYVATNPFFDNWIVLILFGLLFLFTALVGTVFKTNKATAIIGLADNYLSNHAAILINIVVILAPTFFLNNDQVVQEASFISLTLKTILVLIASVYFLIVVTTVRFFIDILIFLTPIPLIDSILEIAKIFITIIFIAVSIFFPTLSVILSVITFIIALTMYKKSLRLVSKTTYLFIRPILNMFKNKERILSKNHSFSIRVYMNYKTQKFKKGSVVRLEKKLDGFYLVKYKFLLTKTEEKIDLQNCTISQGSLKSVITNESETISLFLNRSYHKYSEEISDTLNITQKTNQPLLVMNSEKGFVNTIKTMFDKEDVEELKLTD